MSETCLGRFGHQILLCFSVLIWSTTHYPTSELWRIIETSVRRTSSATMHILVGYYNEQGHTIDLTYEFSEHFRTGDAVEVHSTLLLDIPRTVTSEDLTVRLKKSIYGNFIFAPIALLISSSLGLYYRKNIEFGFNLSVTSFVILILTTFLLLLL